MLIRQNYLTTVTSSLLQFPVVALLGPRQCGKTTLARQIAGNHLSATEMRLNFFDLEDSEDLARLSDVKLALTPLRGLIVIDEIQRLPDLFQTLRVLADRPGSPAKFLILGSASRELIHQSSETLAGRIRHIEVTPFQLSELGASKAEQLWLRGGFPQSFNATSDEASWIWRKEYVRTYLEQDLPNLGLRIPPQHMRRFWTMLAHFHGQIFNASQLARSLDLSDHTIKRYLDILSSTFMIRQLPPWYENTKKRQIKSPKIYFRDSGIFHFLQGIESRTDLMVNPKLGASWEGFAIEQVIDTINSVSDQFYFWGIHGSAELDLVAFEKGKKIGFEVKHTSSPALTHSMKVAIDELKLDQLIIIFNGEKTMRLSQRVIALPLATFVESGKIKFD